MQRIQRGVIHRIKHIVGPEGSRKLLPAYRLLLGSVEAAHALSPFAVHLQRQVPAHFKIGMAVLAHERPNYLEMCLDSLFNTNLHGYDITFLIQDDGSTDERVREIIERPRSLEYKVVRSFQTKGGNSWGAAFNRAMHSLLELDDFDILGSCDADALFHPDWLDNTMKVCLWAKAHHRRHILGPFSSFNSSDYRFHRILGVYHSPYGNYVVKARMGALNYFYFREDLLKLGFFSENRDDETQMTKKFNDLRVRNFCTETSYVEHLGQESVLNQWRPTPVAAAVYALNLPSTGWPEAIKRADTHGYYKYVKKTVSFGKDVSSDLPLGVLVPLVEKDLPVFPSVIEALRQNLRHPIERVAVVSPDSAAIRQACRQASCDFICETDVLPLDKADISYTVAGIDRSGWMLQQLIKLAGEQLFTHEHFLALDADTILACPQVFESGGRLVLLHSDEYHLPYFQMYQRLFAYPACTHLSCVAHMMVFNTNLLAEMKAELEKRSGLPWFLAILNQLDRTQLSGFSEYETYGQWLIYHYPDRVLREYWFNQSIPRKKLREFYPPREDASCAFRSLSFHDRPRPLTGGVE